MADFQGIFCRPFPPSVLIIEGVRGMGGGVGREGGGKNHPWGYSMSSHDTHTVANDTSVGQTNPGRQWEQIQVPTAQLAPSMGAIVPALSLEGRQNAPQKSRPVNI